MKYFTKKMWAGWQGRDAAVWNAAFKTSSTAYMKQLAALKIRLSKRNHALFTAMPFHDSRLIELRMGEPSATAWKADPPAFTPFPTAVEMDVLTCDRRFCYTLRYKQVRNVQVNFPSDQPLFYEEGSGLDDWGYDELTAADERFLSHEILFSSGATILIEFMVFNYSRCKLAVSRPRKLG